MEPANQKAASNQKPESKTYAPELIAVLERAMKGDESCVPELRQALDRADQEAGDQRDQEPAGLGERPEQEHKERAERDQSSQTATRPTQRADPSADDHGRRHHGPAVGGDRDPDSFARDFRFQRHRLHLMASYLHDRLIPFMPEGSSMAPPMGSMAMNCSPRTPCVVT